MPKDKKQLKEGLPSILKKFTDDFFDGLKSQAINRAVEKAKKSELPPPLVQHMVKMQREADRFHELLKDLEDSGRI